MLHINICTQIYQFWSICLNI